MARPIWKMPQPFVHRFGVAGEQLRTFGAVEVRPDPGNKRHLKIYHSLNPGSDTHGLFVASDRGLDVIEAGEQVLVVQYFGQVVTRAILRRGENVTSGVYERGQMINGTPLVNCGDGTGALVAASRFNSVPAYAGVSLETVDLTDSEHDQIIQIRTCLCSGEMANVG